MKIGKSANLGFGLAVACALLAAVPAKADGIDDFFSNAMTTMGLRKDGNAGIEYRERSPLVIPPKRDLPAPDSSAALANPAWPKDPDVEAAKAAGKGDNPVDQDYVLKPDQMTPGRKTGKNARVQGAVDSAPRGTDFNEAARPLRPSELGYSGGLFGMFKSSKEEEIGKFTTEPPRAVLTQPPTGYQTPSPSSPYGIGKDNTPTKPVDYKEVHGTTN